jgi:hypothetical protein
MHPFKAHQAKSAKFSGIGATYFFFGVPWHFCRSPFFVGAGFGFGFCVGRFIMAWLLLL